MKENHQSIDLIYSKLGILQKNPTIRNTIHTGTLRQKLNTNFSSVVNSSEKTSWSSNIQNSKFN